MLLQLSWLPLHAYWNVAFDKARSLEDPTEIGGAFTRLAAFNMDFLQTAQLDRAFQKLSKISPLPLQQFRPTRLALLGSSTLKHLIPAIRMAGLRRGLNIDVFEGEYGQ